MSETSNMESKFPAQEIKFGIEPPKSILVQKSELSSPNNVVDINDLIDVDSNVINYGQFICGKILGSTLLLTNMSDKEQSISLAISKKTHYDADSIFG